ncbi:unnamed protein product [Symbiodinium natans]|uniref:Alpha 1,4-glycosyltransferase domain-containing protein n=1 Tax=Symbiodinium natans TaxID=878477 RepID=A0A812U191_9DINO|nr:unnamed protein product [Symbiodinium natans]
MAGGSFPRLVLLLACSGVLSHEAESEATDVDGLALLTSRTRPHRAQRRGPRIPANILFNYKINLFESRLHGDDDDTELLRVLRKNCEHTVDSFGGDVAKVYFYDDKVCIAELKNLEGFDGKRLAAGFKAFKNGRFKSDLCRLVQLYNHGGYYFDTDILPVRSVRKVLEEETTFATSRSVFQNEIFQAFLAATPKHPFIAEQLREFEQWLAEKHEEDEHVNLGCWLLQRSLANWDHRVNDHPVVKKDSEVVRFFQEDNIENLKGRYRGLLAGKAKWKECRVAVVDEAIEQVVMYSRVVTTNHHDVCTEELDILDSEV